jgi:type VI secretion system protein ImpM
MPLTKAEPTGWVGKIPSRGDFVSSLPMAVNRVWDAFVSDCMEHAKAHRTLSWPDIWLQAPVWRFALPATMCGPAPLLGLWMPSIDKVGRHFPLMIGATSPAATPEQMARHATAWLNAAEEAGRAAIAEDLTPDQLTALIPPSPDLSAQPDSGLPFDLQPRAGAGLWWTDGSPLVPAQGLVLDTMPDRATFVTMLDGSRKAP